MKKMIFFLLPLFILGQDSIIPKNVQKTLNKAADYYNVSLYEEAKLILLELLYSEEGTAYEAEIRYHLGLSCYFSKNVSDAYTQWRQIISKYPLSNRAKELNRIASHLSDSRNGIDYEKSEDFEFTKELETAKLFWKPVAMDAKLDWKSLQDGKRAINFYSKLVQKYDDPKKKFKCLFYIVLLKAGINDNNYGYNPEIQKTNILNVKHLQAIKHYLIKMEEQIINGEIDPNHNLLIEAYYLAGVKVSGSKFFNDNIKNNDDSKQLFQKVIELTENKQNNVYRLFAEHWLKMG